MGKKIIQGELEVTGQVTIPETPTADASAASKKYTDTQLALKENLSNKVQELSSASTTAQYPSAKAVYDLSVDLREVAEGKCKSFVLSYSDTIASIKAVSNKVFYVWNNDDAIWEDKTAELADGDYDNITIRNNVFNSNGNEVQAYDGIIFRSIGGNEQASTSLNFYLVPNFIAFAYNSLAKNEIKVGDIILIVETDVPDRWIESRGAPVVCYKLETSKIDLTSYATKAYVNEKITGVYSASATYAVGDLVIYQNALYRCITAVSVAESFDSNKWTSTDIAGAFVNKYNAVVSSSMLPDTTNSYDIGSNSNLFNRIYATGLTINNTNVSGGRWTIVSGSYVLYFRLGTIEQTYYFFESGVFRSPSHIPTAANTYDLGTSTYTWKDLYLSGLAHIGSNFTLEQSASGNLLIKDSGSTMLNISNNYGIISSNLLRPSANNAYDLGTSAYTWKDLYLGGEVNFGSKVSGRTTVCKIYIDNYDGVNIISNNVGVATFYDNAIYFKKNVLPNSNNTFDLGSSTTKYKDLYLSGKAYTIDIDPQASNLYLGTYGYYTIVRSSNIVPSADGNRDLGRSTVRWQHLYLSGNLSDGTASRTVAGLSGLNASPTVSSNSVSLPYDTISTLSLSADTTVTLDAAPTGCTPEYKGIITNSHATDAITFTFTGVSNIICNDENCVVTNTTNSTIVLPAGVSIEFSIMNGKMVAINWNH